MKNNISPPVYSQIALDIATRIAGGILKENTKIYGRSILSSEYGVSPETIRRAVNLLHDMEIVEIKQNSGVIVLSKEKASEYIAKFSSQNDLRALRRNLKKTVEEQELSLSKIKELVNVVINLNEKFSSTNPFQNYEMEIPENSCVAGKSISELKFWQVTGATVIALRRGEQIILSPGPYMVFQPLDVIVFVGDYTTIETVKNLVNGI